MKSKLRRSLTVWLSKMITINVSSGTHLACGLDSICLENIESLSEMIFDRTKKDDFKVLKLSILYSGFREKYKYVASRGQCQ